MGRRRQFTNEFKLEAVKLAERGDRPVAQVARELDLHETVLRRWMQRLVERIEVFPLMEPFQETQETEEPGVVQVMRSRWLDKVRIRFRGSGNSRVLLLKGRAVSKERA